MGDGNIAPSRLLAYTADMMRRQRHIAPSRVHSMLRRPSSKALNALRLSPVEKRALVSALHGLDVQAYVFGSRTLAEARGGDVDILVIPYARDYSDYRVSQQVVVAFQRVCEEKVDVVVLPRRMNEGQRAFFRTIKKVRVK